MSDDKIDDEFRGNRLPEFPVDAHDIALAIFDVVHRSRALNEIDMVMAEQRGQFIPNLPEWEIVDEAWRALRVPFGWPPAVTP